MRSAPIALAFCPLPARAGVHAGPLLGHPQSPSSPSEFLAAISFQAFTPPSPAQRPQLERSDLSNTLQARAGRDTRGTCLPCSGRTAQSALTPKERGQAAAPSLSSAGRTLQPSMECTCLRRQLSNRPGTGDWGHGHPQRLMETSNKQPRPSRLPRGFPVNAIACFSPPLHFQDYSRALYR